MLAVVGGGEGEVDVDLLTLDQQLGGGEALLGEGLDGLVLGGGRGRDGFGKVDGTVGTVTEDVHDLVGGLLGGVLEDGPNQGPGVGRHVFSGHLGYFYRE